MDFVKNKVENIKQFGLLTKICNSAIAVIMIIIALVNSNFILIAPALLIVLAGFVIGEALDGFAILIEDIHCMRKLQEPNVEAIKE